jgi:hypothetical protein
MTGNEYQKDLFQDEMPSKGAFDVRRLGKR